MSLKAKDILKMDLYGLLGIESTATPKEIKKAYRQKALECHPDKNPDNPKAAELFHQLSQALDVLTDAAAKAAYDKTCAAKKRAEERDRELDDKRKKFKKDLEARERQAEAQRQEELQATLREQEIARLREEGRMMVEEHNRKQTERWREAQKQAKAPGADRNSRGNVTPVLKLKWKCKKDSETNGGYSQDVLLKLLQKYGDVLTVLVSTKKKGLAIVEFATVKAAEMAVNYERGLSENPLKISWQDGKPEATGSQAQPGQFQSDREGSLINDKDYESLVLMRMRQAAERQKLTEQMQKEDEEDAEL